MTRGRIPPMVDAMLIGGGIGDIFQVRKIHQHSEMLESSQRQIAGLHREIDELRLHLAVVISLLIRNGTATSEVYKQIADAIDASDGLGDGAFNGTIAGDGTMTGESSRAYPNVRDTVQALKKMAAKAEARQATDPSP